ncbi:hypothetical protein [Kangiella marina]|uniref:Tetratricopeptide repeat protein n=1 Tax=Kangiella marina TaxID=1079178 RepID=A0ABP8IF60_9GAMM
MANNKLQPLTSAALSLLVFFYAPSINAEEWVPKNPDDIILEYPVNKSAVTGELDQTPETVLDSVETLIEESQYPGKSSRLMVAENQLATIKPGELSKELSNQYYLAKANIAQSKHQFISALAHLSNIDPNSRYHPQRLLIAARIHIIENNLSEAEKKCRELIKSHVSAAELCLIETKVHQGKTEEVLRSVKLLVRKYKDTESPLTRYYHQVKGSMFRVMDDFAQAKIEFQYHLEKAPVSQWYQWSDMAFASGSPKEAYTQLSKIADRYSTIEDGLLVRLARAEKLSDTGTQYQKLANEKIALRILRKDDIHAADIAYYYTYVSPNPEVALTWAQKNWQHVKEPADRELLEHAQQLNN